MPELTTCEDASAWDAFVSQARDASVLQAWAWGSLKSRYGWRATRYFWGESRRPTGAVAVLRRGLPGGFQLCYAPRGPILDGHLGQWPEFWQALRERLAAEGGTVLKVDPEWTTDAERAALQSTGGLASRHPIQHQATMVVDISGGDDALMRLKESTRRNIRTGERQGITVEASDASAAMETFYELLVETAAREQFTIRPLSYYQDLLARFGWTIERLLVQDGRHGLCSLQRSATLFPGGAVYYVPRGPAVIESARIQLLDALERGARAGGGLVLRVEPNDRVGDQWQAFFAGREFIQGDPIQPQATQLLDIDRDPEALKASFKPKTRYNLGLAERKGVTVSGSKNIDTFARLARQTANRQGIHLPG